MRVKSSIINISTGIGSQLVLMLIGFVSRTMFINYLGATYLGINGLFTNVLGMLSLAELGIGSSIIYSLYKPVAENDENKIKLLMNLYKKAYLVIGLIVLFLGLSLIPFLHYFIKGANINHLYIIYVLFLLNTVASYLFVHKISLLNVHQKGYIVTGIYSLSSIVATIIKILILVITRNYILYLLTDIIITFTTSVILSFIVNKMYPFIKTKVTGKLDNETKQTIVKNVRALVLHNIGGYCVFGTDNILISSFVSVVAVGLYSNYNMLLNMCRTFINQVFDNITYSVGNLVAVESKDKIYSIFRVTMFFNFWIYSFFSIFLFVIIEPFISIWLGNHYLMGKSVLIILLLNFYVSGMRRSISTVKTTAGIYREDRYAPMFEAVINLVVSILLVRHIGITGVFIGTLVSTLLVPFWIAPYLVYKKVFMKSIIDYLKLYSLYAAIGMGALLVTSIVGNYIFITNAYINLIIRILLCLTIPNLLYIILFFKTNEFKYLHEVLKLLFRKVKGRVKFSKKVSAGVR